MRFGICTSLENAKNALHAGFDYVELPASNIALASPWNSSIYEGIPVEVTNLFFPNGFDLYGKKEWSSYSSTLFERATQLSIEVMVVGGGGVRRSRPQSSIVDGLQSLFSGSSIPVSGRKAEQMFMKILCQMQKGTDIVLAPESLNRTETDCFTDCMTLANSCHKSKLGYTADCYHILFEWDKSGREGGKSAPTEFFWSDQLPFKPSHCHVAALDGRFAPGLNDPMIAGFFRRLSKLRYEGRISFECNSLAPDEYSVALGILKSYVS